MGQERALLSLSFLLILLQKTDEMTSRARRTSLQMGISPLTVCLQRRISSRLSGSASERVLFLSLSLQTIKEKSGKSILFISQNYQHSPSGIHFGKNWGRRMEIEGSTRLSRALSGHEYLARQIRRSPPPPPSSRRQRRVRFCRTTTRT